MDKSLFDVFINDPFVLTDKSAFTRSAIAKWLINKRIDRRRKITAKTKQLELLAKVYICAWDIISWLFQRHYIDRYPRLRDQYPSPYHFFAAIVHELKIIDIINNGDTLATAKEKVNAYDSMAVRRYVVNLINKEENPHTYNFFLLSMIFDCKDFKFMLEAIEKFNSSQLP